MLRKRGAIARRFARTWSHPLAPSATSSPTQPLSPVQALLIAVSVWGLFAMPVTYTGGASLPHPHSFVQFLREAESGTMSHHAMPDMEETAIDREAMEHAPLRPAGDEAVNDSPLLSPLSYGIDRIALLGLAQPGLAAGIFVTFAAIWLAAIRLTGRVISPLIPPPRNHGENANINGLRRRNPEIRRSSFVCIPGSEPRERSNPHRSVGDAFIA